MEKDEVHERNEDNWVTWVARGPGVPGGSEVIWIARDTRMPGAPGGSEVIWIARDTRMPGAPGKNWNYKLNPEKSAKKKQA